MYGFISSYKCLIIELLLTFFHVKKMEFIDTLDKCILESTLMLLPQGQTWLPMALKSFVPSV